MKEKVNMLPVQLWCINVIIASESLHSVNIMKAVLNNETVEWDHLLSCAPMLCKSQGSSVNDERTHQVKGNCRLGPRPS